MPPLRGDCGGASSAAAAAARATAARLAPPARGLTGGPASAAAAAWGLSGCMPGVVEGRAVSLVRGVSGVGVWSGCSCTAAAGGCPCCCGRCLRLGAGIWGVAATAAADEEGPLPAAAGASAGEPAASTACGCGCCSASSSPSSASSARSAGTDVQQKQSVAAAGGHQASNSKPWHQQASNSKPWHQSPAGIPPTQPPHPNAMPLPTASHLASLLLLEAHHAQWGPIACAQCAREPSFGEAAPPPLLPPQPPHPQPARHSPGWQRLGCRCLLPWRQRCACGRLQVPLWASRPAARQPRLLAQLTVQTPLPPSPHPHPPHLRCPPPHRCPPQSCPLAGCR